MVLKSIKGVFLLFDKKEKKQAYVLLSLVVIRGVFEVVGVASIVPFIAVAANPDLVYSNKYLLTLYNLLCFTSPKSFLVTLGIGVFSILLFNNALAAFTDWKLARFTYLRGHSIAQRLFMKYLSQPYVYFLNSNSSELIANVITETVQFMKGVMLPFMNLVSKCVVSVCILLLLLYVDFLLASIVFLVLGSAFGAIFLGMRKTIKNIGESRSFNNQQQIKYLKEAFEGIKELKVKNCEQYFSQHFSQHSFKTNISQATHQIISQMPRYCLEVVGFGGILLITIYLLMTQSDTSKTIPLLALYAFAGYRLMPALQGVFIGLTNMKYNYFLIKKLSKDLDMETYPYEEISQWAEAHEKMHYSKEIKIDNVSYTYPNTEKLVLDSINLSIPFGATIGIVGMTGSGKTTLIDIILGLLQPQKGSLFVDETKIDKNNQRKWMNSIGYVPQHIFLADTTIRENIAFGIDPDKVDFSQIETAAKSAMIDDFVQSELPDNYDTVIGESGVRLSGGQRQRIGIARAFYSDPGLLVFDEATSALDNFTEKRIMELIQPNKNKKTIIMIAHRLSTLTDCDVIYVMSKGKIVNWGTYSYLEEHCEYFKELSKSTH